MKGILSFLLLVSYGGALGATTLYVKPGASGAGASWDDAADLETAVAAARDGADVTTVYAAKGLYALASTLKLNGQVALYGGFAGVSADETPEARDLSANQTVLSGDVNGDDVWMRCDTLAGSTAETEEPIVRDGRINALAFANDRDTYVPADKNGSDNLWRVVTVMQDAADTGVLDGVVITGGGRGYRNSNGTAEDGVRLDRGSALFVASGARPQIRNCRIVGNTAFAGCVFFESSLPTFENCEVSFNRSGYYGALYSSFSQAIVRNTAFVGNYRQTDFNSSGAAAVELNRELTLRNCTFTRNGLRKSHPNSPQEAVCINTEYGDYSNLHVFDCTFRNNACRDTYGGAPAPMVYDYHHQKSLTGCHFVSNTTVTSASSVPVAYSVGCVYFRDEATILDGCTFENNEISVTAPAATTVIAAPCLGESVCHQVVNTTFLDNRVAVVAAASLTNLVSRALVWTGPSGGNYVFNSTFAGVSAGPDVVSRSTAAEAPGVTVLNSVLWATGAAAEVPRVVCMGTAGATVACSVLCNPGCLGDDVVLSETSGADPLLCPLATLVDGKPPVMQLGARLPGVRDTYDVATFVWYNAHQHAYRRTPTSAWEHVRGSGGTKVLVGDAVGAVRPAGGFTVGAVQALSERAESGLTVVYRTDPSDVARLDGKTTQVVAVGEACEPVAAVSTNSFYSFSRWRTASGGAYATENPLTVSATEAGVLELTAQFNPAFVSYTFDLGPHATFDEDGTSEKTVTLVPESAVAIPAYTLRDGRAFKAWSPALPGEVGTQDARFVLQAYCRETHLRPGDDVAAAVAEAAHYPGDATVSLAAGVYEPAAAFPLPSNVRLVGEAGAVLRRSAQDQWTIQNPDSSADTGWLRISGVTFERGGVSPGANPAYLADCVFTNCLNGEKGALGLLTNAVTVNCGFYGSQMAVKANGSSLHPIRYWATNCVFRGNRNATASGGRSFGAAAALSSCAQVTLHGCLFERNWSANKGSFHGILSAGALEMTRCRFVDNVCTGDVAMLTLGYASQCDLKHNLFLRNRLVGDRGNASTDVTALLNDGNIGTKNIVGCSFVSNVIDRTEAETSAATTVLQCSLIHRNGRFFQRLRSNFFEGNVIRARATNPATRVVASVCSCSAPSGDCSMEGNTFHDNTAANGDICLNQAVGNLWIWNSLFDGKGAEASPISYVSETDVGTVHLRHTRAPVQGDARIVRDATCRVGEVTFAPRTVEIDGLVVRPLFVATGARTRPVRIFITSNNKAMYYNESQEAYRRLDGDCWDAYMTQYTPYTVLEGMFGEQLEGRRALAGAYQLLDPAGLAIIVR